MTAFEYFRVHYYDEYGIGANEVTPGNIRSLSNDDFDGRVFNGEHLKKV